MATHLSGKNGNVYTSPQLVDNCEAAWSVAGNGQADTAATDADHKVGDTSVKMVCGVGVAATNILATKEISPTIDLITPVYTHLMYWAQCTDTFGAAGDMQIGVSETTDMGGTPVYSDIPLLTAATWKYCISTLATTGLDAVRSVGAKLIEDDFGAFDLYLDDIRAGKIVAGIRAWTRAYVCDA